MSVNAVLLHFLSTESVNTSTMHKKKMICCMPGCLWTSTIKHTCIYEIKPLWWPFIHAHIKKVVPNFQTTPRLLSHMICTRHIRSCGIPDKPLESPVHFPFLKISVRGQPQTDLSRLQKYSSEEIVVGREVTIPVAKGVIGVIDSQVESTRQKRILIRKKYPYDDHAYTASASELKLFQAEVVKLDNENTDLKNQIANMTAGFDQKRQHLDRVTHQLIEKNIKYITPDIEYPFKCMPENKQILEFYTGFSNWKCFLKLVAFVRPKYDQARLIENLKNRKSVRRDTLGIENQLALFLSRLRLGLVFEDLAYRFNISVNLVIQIWIFWLKLMNDVLVKGSPNLDTKSCSPKLNRNMVVECCETFFEVITPNAKTRKQYGRVRSVLELRADGCVVNVSDLFTAQSNYTQFVGNIQSLNCIKSDKEAVKMFQNHVQKTLQFVKGFQIMKGAFPNATCDIDEINIFWKICCFLMNFSHPKQTVKNTCSGGRSST